ncbi:hypothetical protein [Embleya sp. NPDC050493]
MSKDGFVRLAKATSKAPDSVESDAFVERMEGAATRAGADHASAPVLGFG